jgi:hypothetical protein
MFSANITNRDPAKILLKNTADRGFPLVKVLTPTEQLSPPRSTTARGGR